MNNRTRMPAEGIDLRIPPSERQENPWHRLPSKTPYVLACDHESVESYNQRQTNPLKRVVLENLPEPYIGNPETATVLLLNLNPGHSDRDKPAHENQRFRQALRSNLIHEPQSYPFYAFSPVFSWTACAEWWLKHAGELVHAVGLETIAERLMVIEWFAYHSPKCGLPGRPFCPSQKYSFNPAKRMVDKGALILGMRSRERWCNADKMFERVQFPLKVFQCGYLSRNNLKDGWFDRIVATLRKK